MHFQQVVLPPQSLPEHPKETGEQPEFAYGHCARENLQTRILFPCPESCRCYYCSSLFLPSSHPLFLPPVFSVVELRHFPVVWLDTWVSVFLCSLQNQLIVKLLQCSRPCSFLGQRRAVCEAVTKPQSAGV